MSDDFFKLKSKKPSFSIVENEGFSIKMDLKNLTAQRSLSECNERSDL